MSGNASILDDGNEIIYGDRSLPRIKEAVPLDGRKIRVTFHDGRTKTVDLGPIVESHRFFIALRDNDELFRSFKVSEWGEAIEWNDELDYPADGLEALPSVDFTNEDFRNAMDELRLTLDGMAAALGVSRRLIADYRKDKPIPRHIGFATRYLVDRRTRRNVA
jgi:hypothetical protein